MYASVSRTVVSTSMTFRPRSTWDSSARYANLSAAPARIQHPRDRRRRQALIGGVQIGGLEQMAVDEQVRHSHEREHQQPQRSQLQLLLARQADVLVACR